MGRKFPATTENPCETGLLRRSRNCALTLALPFFWMVLGIVFFPSKAVFAQVDKSGNSRQKIELPDNPRAAPPPRPTLPERQNGRDLEEADLEIKRTQREAREKRFQPPEISREEKKANDLGEDAQKSRPLQLFFEASMLRPGIKTQGERRSYTLDTTSHFQLFVRAEKELPINKIQLWWGVRLAPFAGSGVYKNIPGRFGFFYFGPMVGLGKLDTLRDTLGDSPRGSENEKKALPVQHGWLVTSGIAAQNRIGDASRDQDKLDEDLNSKQISFDAPGVWIEFRYLSVHYGALGVDLFTGAQAGKQKQFYWAGLGVAGWY